MEYLDVYREWLYFTKWETKVLILKSNIIQQTTTINDIYKIADDLQTELIQYVSLYLLNEVQPSI